MPASRLPSVFCAAKPRMMPAIPAEARMLAPSCRTVSNIIRIEATPKMITTEMMILRMTETWV